MKTLTTLHKSITLRGNRQDAFKFAFGYKGGKKGCFTKGCEIFTQSFLSLKNTDVQHAITLDMMHQGEIDIDLEILL